MNRQDKVSLYIYSKLLKLYPLSYREEYESEMVDTMQDMLKDTNSLTEKVSLLKLAFKDYLLSLTQQNIQVLENAALESPGYIRQSSTLSTSLVLPFFIICSYNLLNQYVLRHPIPFARLEAKTWIIYCIIMPAIAAILVALAVVKSAFDRRKHRNNPTSEWLLLGIPLSLLIIFAVV